SQMEGGNSDSRRKGEKTAAEESGSPFGLSKEEEMELAEAEDIVSKKFGRKFDPFAWIEKNFHRAPLVHLAVMKAMAREKEDLRDLWARANEIRDWKLSGNDAPGNLKDEF